MFSTLFPKKIMPRKTDTEKVLLQELAAYKTNLMENAPQNLLIRSSKVLLRKVYFQILISCKIFPKQKLKPTFRKKWTCQRCWVLIFFIFNYFLFCNILVEVVAALHSVSFFHSINKNLSIHNGIIIPYVLLYDVS